MTELSEFFVRTSKGTIHRAMTDSENNVYSWKRCRLATAKFSPVDREAMAEADPAAFCQICTPSRD